jgi:hypothetical protein
VPRDVLTVLSELKGGVRIPLLDGTYSITRAATAAYNRVSRRPQSCPMSPPTHLFSSQLCVWVVGASLSLPGARKKTALTGERVPRERWNERLVLGSASGRVRLYEFCDIKIEELGKQQSAIAQYFGIIDRILFDERYSSVRKWASDQERVGSAGGRVHRSIGAITVPDSESDLSASPMGALGSAGMGESRRGFSVTDEPDILDTVAE